MSGSTLSVRGLTKRFEAGTVNEKLALDHLDLEVPAGQFVTVLGSNGSGKSTLFNTILGRVIPDSGSILLGEEDITRQKDYRRALNMSCLYQNPLRGTAPTMTLEENLALAYTRKASKSFFAVNRRDNAYFRDLLATLNMGLEDRMKTKMGLLSGGQRQALTLLMATLQKPKLLLLDEHTAALDPKTAAKVMEVTRRIVNRDRLTTLMITHNMRDAIEYGDRLIMMYEGRIALDIAGEEKQKLTVEDLLAKFGQATGSSEADDKLLLS